MSITNNKITRSQFLKFSYFMIITMFLVLGAFSWMLYNMILTVHEEKQALENYKNVMQQIAIQGNTYIDANGDKRDGYGHCIECKRTAIKGGFKKLILREELLDEVKQVSSNENIKLSKSLDGKFIMQLFEYTSDGRTYMPLATFSQMVDCKKVKEKMSVEKITCSRSSFKSLE